MNFILQPNEDILVIEKRAIRSAQMLADNILFVPYTEHFSSLPSDICPVGSVEFCQKFMTEKGIKTPSHITYPEVLIPWLGRKLSVSTIGEMIKNERNPNFRQFIKPKNDVKLFTGFVFEGKGQINPEEHELSYYPSLTEIYVSEVIKFQSEWRYYVLNGEVVGFGRYDDGDDYAKIPDVKTVNLAVYDYTQSGNTPKGYSLDFGVTDDGRTLLIEVNDGWALGYYRGTLSTINYAKLLYARWMEISLSNG